MIEILGKTKGIDTREPRRFTGGPEGRPVALQRRHPIAVVNQKKTIGNNDPINTESLILAQDERWRRG